MDTRREAASLNRRVLSSLMNGHGREIPKETPLRAVKGLAELLSGYHEDPKQHVKLFDTPLDEVVVVRGISFASVCEHHVLPFWGKCAVAYIPHRKVLGLSKFARIVNVYARRLQTQERLTDEIARFLQKSLKPKGLAVIMQAVHTCAAVRGVRDQSIEMKTSRLLGAFRKHHAARMEVFNLIGANA